MISIILCTCEAIAQVSEGFENSTFPPAGWTVYSAGTTSTWGRITSNTRNSSNGAANSLSPAAGSAKHLTISLNIASNASSISYYVSVSSMQHGSGATLTILAGTDTTALTTLRTISLDSSSVFSFENTYVQFTDNIDGTTASGQTGSVDLRSTNPAYIRWTHQKVTGTSPSCRLEDLSIPNAVALPVEFISFIATVNGRRVQLAWKTATETNNHGFEVQRSAVGGQSSERNWTVVGFVAGNGTVSAQNEYSYTDRVPVTGTYEYRLKQIDNDGRSEYHGAASVTIGSLASGLELAQNHPNPFNPTTNIAFALAKDEFVSLKVYDMLGKEITTLVNGRQSAGAYTMPFDASSYPSGIYFYTLRAGNSVETKKMLLVK